MNLVEMSIVSALLSEDQMYGRAIREFIEENFWSPCEQGTIYAALIRMEEKDMVRYKLVPTSNPRGGQKRKVYQINPSAKESIYR